MRGFMQPKKGEGETKLQAIIEGVKKVSLNLIGSMIE